MKKYRQSAIYEYLLNTGVLESSPEMIAAARKAYWLQYRRNWVRSKRKAEKEFTVRFTKEEVAIVSGAAKKHKRSITRFTKEAALCYIKKQFLVPDVTAVLEIRELLSLCYSAIRKLTVDAQLPNEIGNMILQRMADLEREVLTRLQHPKLVENDS